MDLSVLSIPLPEDLMKLKWNGQFELMKEMIDLRIQKDIPQQLKERLILEKNILDDLKREFIYTKEEALEILRNKISDVYKRQVEGLVSKSRPTNSTISFTWGNATKDIISGYEIWRSTTGNFADYKKVADVSTNSYTDKELNASTTYYYKVRAVNGQGSLLEDNKINGEFSDVLELTTLQGEAPKAPKNLTIKDAGDNKATISWDKSESSNVVKYEVYKAVSAYAPFEKVGETDALSYTVTYTRCV